MPISDFILDMLDRMQQAVMEAVDSLSREELAWRPEPEANPIGFILWHQLRCEDAFVQGLIQRKTQVWVTEKWYQKLNLPENPMDNGYGYTAEQVAVFPILELSDLSGYAEAVRSRTLEYLKGVPPDKFDEVIQAGVFKGLAISKVFSLLLCEITQHIGQIAYLRGLQRGLNK
jgi:hypothetical protein